MLFSFVWDSLPPVYVVWREGNSFTLLVCPHLGGGYPYPIMLCNIIQNSMGQTPRGGTQPGPARGGTLPGGYPAGVVHQWGGTPMRGDLTGGTLGTPPSDLDQEGTLTGRVPWWGGTLGTPHQTWMGRYPDRVGTLGTPHQTWTGVPWCGVPRVPPHQTWMGGYPARGVPS